MARPRRAAAPARRRRRATGGRAPAAATRGEPRVRLDLDRRRAQLLELGIDLFSKHSYEDMSIDEVAEAAGISKGLLYHYFRSKRDFYVETVRAASRRLQLLTIPDPELPPAARLRAAIDAHLRYIQEHGPVYTAVYRNGVAIAPEIREILEQHRGVIVEYFLEAMGASRPRPLLRTALRSWMAMVEGASLDWIDNPSITRDALRELLVAGYAALIIKTIELDAESDAANAIRVD
ncbi:MAG TPA: TetR/AcrR family transcriptional regulator [Polyangia bacterium]